MEDLTAETYVINEKAINIIAKSYNTLDYYVKLNELLKAVYPASDFNHLTKYELHKMLNDVLVEKYNGEEILKYRLYQQYLNKRSIVAAFEIKVNNSRVDFLTINGHTRSFEIKSELDNLSKLSKQMADYMLVFEYNCLVIDEKHMEKAQELLPPSFGLWSYKKGKYIKRKASELNTKIDPEVQLSLLTKRELAETFPHQEGIREILVSWNAQSINHQFKKALKNRYRSRWEFLTTNQASILPIDIQFFFNTNIQPEYIYY